MATSEARADERVKDVSFTEDALIVDLQDGRRYLGAVGLVSPSPVRDAGSTAELACRRSGVRHPLA
jgi:hypothetical protein